MNTQGNRRKKAILGAAIMVAVLLVLFFPIPGGTYDDGGTRDYNAVTYKIVVWNRYNISAVGVSEDGSEFDRNRYQKTSVYWFPDNRKSIDELWKIEQTKNG